MPTTDVFIESVEKRIRNFSHESQELSLNSLPSPEQEGCAENVTAVDLLNDFICELEPRKNYLKVHCRVSIFLSVTYEFAVMANRVSFTGWTSVDACFPISIKLTLWPHFLFRLYPCKDLSWSGRFPGHYQGETFLQISYQCRRILRSDGVAS